MLNSTTTMDSIEKIQEVIFFQSTCTQWGGEQQQKNNKKQPIILARNKTSKCLPNLCTMYVHTQTGQASSKYICTCYRVCSQPTHYVGLHVARSWHFLPTLSALPHRWGYGGNCPASWCLLWHTPISPPSECINRTIGRRQRGGAHTILCMSRWEAYSKLSRHTFQYFHSNIFIPYVHVSCSFHAFNPMQLSLTHIIHNWPLKCLSSGACKWRTLHRNGSHSGTPGFPWGWSPSAAFSLQQQYQIQDTERQCSEITMPQVNHWVWKHPVQSTLPPSLSPSHRDHETCSTSNNKHIRLVGLTLKVNEKIIWIG